MSGVSRREILQTSERGYGGAIPRPVFADVRCGLVAQCFCRITVGGDPLHPLDQRVDIRFQQPRFAGGFHAADFVADAASPGRNTISKIVRREIIRRTAGGDDDRQAAGHRFKDGQAETFAAIRMHEAVARGVKPGQFFRREFGVEVYDLRRVGAALHFCNPVAEGLALVKCAAAKIFYDERNIVGRGEGFQKRVEQNVRTFARDGSANEEKLERLLSGKAARFGVGMETFRINAVRHNLHLVRRDAGFHIDIADIVRGHPEFIHLLRLFNPRLRQRTKFPRLDDDEFPLCGTSPVRRPGVADGDLRVCRRFFCERVREFLQPLGHGGIFRQGRRVHALQPDIFRVSERAGQLTVDVRQTSEVEERAFPCGVDAPGRLLGGDSREQHAAAGRGNFCGRLGDETFLGVEGFAPALEEEREVFLDVIEAAIALAFEMIDDGLRFIDHLAAGGADAEAEVNILNAVAINFIEARELQKQIAMNREARAGNHVEFAELVRDRSITGCVTVRVIREAIDEFDAGVLNVAVAVEQLCAGHADVRLLRGLHERVEPAVRHLRIVVQEKQNRTARGLRAEIAGLGKTFVLNICQDANSSGALFHTQIVGGAVGGGIVHDDDFSRRCIRGLRQ